MKNYLKRPFFQLNPETYITLIVILAPLMNFFSGISVDIYSPSMPAISRFFGASVELTKNTISATVLGWTLGCLVIGILIDSLGRRRIFIPCIAGYVIASLLAAQAQSIQALIALRFIQGFMIAAVSLGCRVLVADTTKGPRYAIIIMYTAIGWGSGPIIGPFIGSWLQHTLGWRANFYALALMSFILLMTLLLFLQEKQPKLQPLHLKAIKERFSALLSHRQFVIGLFIAGIIRIQIVLYPTIGPFIVEDTLGKSVLEYGHSALIVGAAYLFGSLLNRALIQYMSIKQICRLGCYFQAAALVLAWFFSHHYTLNLWTVMLPIMLLCISSGLIFTHIMSTGMRLFPHFTGLTVAMMAGSALFISVIGLFLINTIHILHLSQLTGIYAFIVSIQLLLFLFGYQKVLDKPAQPAKPSEDITGCL